MRKCFGGLVVVALWAGSLSSGAEGTEGNGGVLGFWRAPDSSVVHVEKCGQEICLTIVEISKTAPARIDGLNPDPRLKGRSLCGVQIGTAFHLDGEQKAEGGRLYDPKSGKTYKGLFSTQGNTLKLRGYVGIKAFGRSEEWTRTSEVKTCTA